ncbi:MAG: DUF2920 family protein [Peptostreptococcaceae bacterium]|nr:DUF2920 family protein [Peptostreptococcaceae bacterium]
MAKEYSFETYAHPSIYEAKERKLKIYFCEPDAGVDEQTGVLLFIPGFGGNANSKIYRKMRRQFADKHNLVTVQCDYFGWEFMQNTNNVSFDQEELRSLFSPEEQEYIFRDEEYLPRLMEMTKGKNYILSSKADIDEELSNFNDMGIMQALDNLSAVTTVLEVIRDNGHKIDESRVIIAGDSHGGYLGYLCNAFAPGLFSLLIDNSAWIYPVYLLEKRKLYFPLGNGAVMKIHFDYLGRRIEMDEEMLYLPSLYGKFFNRCKIISYHGMDDELILYEDKELFARRVPLCNLNKITESQVDGLRFKSTRHGLDADFMELFEFALDAAGEPDKDKKIELPSFEYKTQRYRYIFDYSHSVPILKVE